MTIKTINMKDFDEIAQQIIRPYGLLPASGLADTYDIFVNEQGAAMLIGYYCEGQSASAAGEITTEISKGVLIDDIFYGSRSTVINHAVPAAGSTILQSRMQTEEFPFKPANTRYIAAAFSSASWVGGIATYTIGVHTLKDGDKITIRGMNPVGFNVDLAEIINTTTTTVSIAMVDDPGAFVAVGTLLECFDFRITFEAPASGEVIRVRVRETGDTTNKGELLLVLSANKL